MSLNKIIQSTILLGVLSIALLFSFYVNQKQFTKNHKEFLLASTELQLKQTELSNNILQSSLKAYFNQDLIAQNVIQLRSTLQKLENAKILKNKNYLLVKQELSSLKEQINQELQNVEVYAMFNAGIKNSMLFLTRYIKKDKFKKDENQNLYLQALLILQRIQDTKNTLDMDNIEGLNLKLKTNKQNIQKTVHAFNAHTNFLKRQLPKFIDTTKSITKNDISQNISTLNALFSKLALNDFKDFDTFALLVLIIFSISFTLLATFFYKYVNAHAKLVSAKSSLENSLIHDELTGLQNRKSFEIEIAKSQKPFVLLINIIGFKNINDIYGNNSGNILLKEFSLFLKEHMKKQPKSKLYRLGSDEFAIICSLEQTEVLSVASTLTQQISRHNFDISVANINIQVNIAINNIKPYLENADLALKLLKKDYSKSILFFEKDFEIKKNITQALKTIDIIKRAIEENRIVPYFQPIVNLQTMKIEKYEALIRLKCLDGTIMQPYQFLELAKKSSYYNKLTKIMIQKTLEIAKTYPQYRFSINISMQDINNNTLMEDIFETFDKNARISSQVDIELLESEDMHDKAKIVKFIKRVRSYGIRISIDDFGTGYSNFSYFSDFEIDYLKIDGSITKEIASHPRKMHIFKSIFEFSKGMNIDNIAEFVENKEILKHLQNIGVKYGQGYYFSKPLPTPLSSDEIILH